MVLSLDELKKIAKLCALKLTDEESEKFLGQLDEILEFVGQLDEVDVDGIEPMRHPIEGKTLKTRSGVVDFEDKKALLKNVTHNMKNNGIVIKSPIKS